MHMRIWLITLAVVALWTGCNEPGTQTTTQKPSAVDSMRNVVMDIHNEAMPWMGEMMQLKRSLNQAIAADSLGTNPATEQYQAAVDSLEQGMDAMKVWMHNWQEPDSTKAEADNLAYLQSEEARMARVKEQMQAALATARDLAQEITP